jgi:hypothetical protein
MDDQIRVGSRVYHRRKGDPESTEGYGKVVEIIGPLKAVILWEHSGITGAVDRRDLTLASDDEDYPAA